MDIGALKKQQADKNKVHRKSESGDGGYNDDFD